ncbi:hypothetical protein ACLB2K_040416 [Fragaria x ananassa]
MPPHPPLHPRLRQGPGASELVTSMKSTSIKSSQLVIIAAVNQARSLLPRPPPLQRPLRPPDHAEDFDLVADLVLRRVDPPRRLVNHLVDCAAGAALNPIGPIQVGEVDHHCL